MKLLLAIIFFHLLAIMAGRNQNSPEIKTFIVLITLTLLMVIIVLYGMFTMETPDVNI